MGWFLTEPLFDIRVTSITRVIALIVLVLVIYIIFSKSWYSFNNILVNGLSFYCDHTFLDEDDEEYADEMMNGDTEFRKCEFKGRELVKHISKCTY